MKLIDDETIECITCSSNVMEMVNKKFLSGNSIPVDRISISREEYLDCFSDKALEMFGEEPRLK